MKIALTYSSKKGLLKEFKIRNKTVSEENNIFEDMFAEGDSPRTIQAILKSLCDLGHEAVGIEVDHQILKRLMNLHPDLVFNVAEGLYGDFRESYVPMICERLGILYTGSGPLTLGICLNKVRAKEVLGFHHIPTAPFQVIYPNDQITVFRSLFPAIIKPVSEGSSKGIYNDSVIDNNRKAVVKIREMLDKYEQPVLIEKFLEGDEYTVAVWGNGNKLEVLPIVAIQYTDLPEGAMPIYSYEAKWIWDTPEKPLNIFRCPADLPFVKEVQISKLVKKTWKILGIRDWCRIDVRMDSEGVPHILEVNPLPGILPNPEDNSCFPKAARTAGYTYEEMLNKVINIACSRAGISNGSVREKTTAAYHL
jgi:D-alanine-D-alanine ligase